MPRPRLVVDSSVAIAAAASGVGLPASHHYLAPRLMWSEAMSALHEGQWRQEMTPREAEAARRALTALPIQRDDPQDLQDVAWRIADELGLAKTYDAEFLALARIRNCRVLTADARLRRVGDRLGLVLDPVEAFGD
jgi:predicted nucleic acid-binding protein